MKDKQNQGSKGQGNQDHGRGNAGHGNWGQGNQGQGKGNYGSGSQGKGHEGQDYLTRDEGDSRGLGNRDQEPDTESQSPAAASRRGDDGESIAPDMAGLAAEVYPGRSTTGPDMSGQAGRHIGSQDR